MQPYRSNGFSARPDNSARGSAGIITPSALVINPHRLLANVIRRTRTLGRLVANPKI
jgi:hypothetical protein